MTAAQLRDIEADKRVATARARIALRGATLHAMKSDRGRPVFIVSHWSLTKEFDEIAAVEAWLAEIEAAQSAGARS